MRNRYGYRRNNPVEMVDLDGMESEAPEEDYGGGITAKIREVTKDWNGVFVGSVTYNLGVIGQVSGGFQGAYDWHGNVVIYPVCGVGAQAGSSAKFDFAVGYLDVPTAEDVKGFGTETGVSAGLFGIVPSISWITSNEDDGEFIGNGGMFHIGLGGNPTIIEAHTSMSGSPEMPRLVNRFNIYDRIDEFGFWMESKI